ncbi:MAG: hypothetical protein J6S08_01740, partial [Duodenibacillus sp.]|nr:hypothetical protein [Duodenibacillus sp.]
GFSPPPQKFRQDFLGNFSAFKEQSVAFLEAFLSYKSLMAQFNLRNLVTVVLRNTVYSSPQSMFIDFLTNSFSS